MAAALALARAVLCPERVNDFRAFVPIVLSLLPGNGKIVEAVREYLLRISVALKPLSPLAVRAVTSVVGHDLWLHFCLDVGKELLYFLDVYIRHFVLRDKPCHGIQVAAKHLHSQARAFDN